MLQHLKTTSGCPISHGGHCFTFAVLRQLPNADFQIKKKIVEEVSLAVHCVIPPVVWRSMSQQAMRTLTKLSRSIFVMPAPRLLHVSSPCQCPPCSRCCAVQKPNMTGEDDTDSETDSNEHLYDVNVVPPLGTWIDLKNGIEFMVRVVRTGNQSSCNCFHAPWLEVQHMEDMPGRLGFPSSNCWCLLLCTSFSEERGGDGRQGQAHQEDLLPEGHREGDQEVWLHDRQGEGRSGRVAVLCLYKHICGMGCALTAPVAAPQVARPSANLTQT